MAEAAAVIGLAASIITLTGVCTKVLTRLIEFESAARGAHGAFQDVAIQLPLIVDIVSQIGKACEDRSLVVDVQQKLVPVVKGCCRHVNALDGLIEKMLPAPADNAICRARKAIMSLRKEKEISRVQDALEEYKSTLTLYTAVATQQRQTAMIHEGLKHRCQAWLKPLPNVRDFHERRLKTKLHGTCDWIWAHPAFIKWDESPSLSAPDRLLCIYGTHGSGKTVLASSIIEGFKAKQLQTLFFYFSGTDPCLQSLGDLVRTLLWQLLEITTDKRGLEIVSKLALSGPPAHSELLDALTSVAALTVGPIYCVIDGVDESSAPTRESFQHILQILESQDNFRAILLGRKHVFQSAVGATAQAIEMNSNLIRQDINALINSEVDAAIDVDLLRLPGLRDSIARTLQEKSDGMPLWVKLMVDDLRRAATQSEIKESLHNLPQGLEEAYRRTFQRLVGVLSDPELVRARKMLAFATVSCHTLNVEEIRYAYALDSESCTAFEERLLTPPVQRILDVCGNFVNIKDGLVQLTHFSVKEFLIRPEDEWLRSGDEKIIGFRVDPAASHLNLGSICFDYLQRAEYGYPLRDSGETEDSFLELGTKFPFLTYASRYMICHFSGSGVPRADTLDKLRDFLRSEKCLSWIEYLVMLSLEGRLGRMLLDDLEKFMSWLGEGLSGRAFFESEIKVRLGQELTKRIQEFGEHDPRVEQWKLLLDFLRLGPADTSGDLSGVDETIHLPTVRAEIFDPALMLNALGNSSPLPLHRQVNVFLGLQSYLQQAKTLTSPLKKLFRIILQKAPTIPVFVLLAIGGFYARLDKLEEALEVYDAALAKVGDQENLVKFAILRAIGGVLESQRNYETAEEMYRRALEGSEKVLGKEHLDTLTAVDHLGSVLVWQDRYKEAEEMYRRALEGGGKVLGQEHRFTLKSMSGLGVALSWQESYEAAEGWCRQALDGREKALGKDHRDTLKSANDLSSVFSALGKYEEAEKLCRQALEGREKVLGKENHNTLHSVATLGNVLYQQGKYEAAEVMHRRALEGREKVLGKEHRDTLNSVADLGHVFYSQGKYKEAEQMYRRAVEGMEKVLGKEHHDTLATLADLNDAREAAEGVTDLSKQPRVLQDEEADNHGANNLPNPLDPRNGRGEEESPTDGA